MTGPALKILEEALGLPKRDREILAVELKRSLEQDEDPRSPGEIDAAWREEIARRLKSLEDGTAELHDWEDVERELLDIVKR